MRIDNLGIGSIDRRDQKNLQDPFDLNLTVTELKLEHKGMAPITSQSLCTPGCGVTGTGNSYCCTCK